MNWNPPDAESGWAECLSAYLDGELPPEEGRALDRYLASNPKRAAQLASLRQTEGWLSDWDIPEPVRDETFLDRLDDAARAARQPARTARRFSGWRWQWQAAMFVLGTVVGIGGTLAYVDGGAPAPNTSSPANLTPAAESSEPVPGISAEQAEGLFQEMAAVSLKERCLRLVRRRRWQEASAAYDSLKRNYPGTTAAQEVADAMNRAQGLGLAITTTRRD